MKKIIPLFLFIALLFPAVSSHAQPTRSTTGGVSQSTTGGPADPSAPSLATLPNPLAGRVDSIPALLKSIVDFLFGFSYIVIAFFLLLSGFKFVAAQGSEEKLREAKNTFKYTIIGALILIGANTIITVAQQLVQSLR